MTLKGIKDGRFEATMIGDRPVDFYFDPNCFRILGYAAPPQGEEFHFLESRLEPGKSKELNAIIYKAVQEQEDFSLKTPIKNSQGIFQWIQMRAGTYRKGEETRILGTWTDIDEEEKLRIQLQKDTENFKMLHRAIRIIRWEYNPKTKLFTLTRDARGTYQMKPMELWDCFKPPYDRLVAQAFEQGCETGTHMDILAEMRHNLEGQENHDWMRIQGFPQESPYPTYIGVAEVVTSLVESQLQYKEQHSILQTLLDNVPFGVFFKEVKNGQASFVLWNHTMSLLDSNFPEKVKNYSDEELFTKNASKVYQRQDKEVISKKTTIDLGQWPSRGRHNEEFIVHVHKVPILNDNGDVKYILGVMENITEKTEMERKLLQAQKLDALGKLAGGVAHDFNNMLAGIMGIAELWNAREEDPVKKAQASNLLQLSRRAADLTEQLLTFSRDRDIEQQPQDIHDIIKESVKLLQRTLDKNIQIVTDLGAQNFVVSGDKTMLLNLFINLSINSRDAMPQGGMLFFLTRNVVLDERKRKSMGISLAQANWILIEVRDTGHGIDPSIQDRIFEPFFSTKDMGKGTGLGLSMVYGNTVKHSGIIQLGESSEGSSFELYFPLRNSISE